MVATFRSGNITTSDPEIEPHSILERAMKYESTSICGIHRRIYEATDGAIESAEPYTSNPRSSH